MRKTHNRTYLYRYFNDSGKLLYVGVTGDPLKRDRQHAYVSPWYALSARHELETFDNRNSALIAERRAIEKEKPAFNSEPGIASAPYDKTAVTNSILSFRVAQTEISAIDKLAQSLQISRTELLKRMLRTFILLETP